MAVGTGVIAGGTEAMDSHFSNHFELDTRGSKQFEQPHAPARSSADARTALLKDELTRIKLRQN